MDTVVEKLETKLSQWKPEISAEIRALISEVIDAADHDALDLIRSRVIEQEVLDHLDEPAARAEYDSMCWR
ncbi:MAG TPA: hypothetical protein VF938_06675 [Candidatus Angelobacter sp.]